MILNIIRHIITIFVMRIRPFFYGKDNNDSEKIKGERSGESPVVLSMPCIGLVRNDSPSLFTQYL